LPAYPIDNAIFRWEEGERRLRAADETTRRRLDRAATTIVDELRRRLGSTFSLAELAELYASGTDWASDLANVGGDSEAVVDAAFGRYARSASDYAGSHPGWRRG
jgi:hypothetical protein